MQQIVNELLSTAALCDARFFAHAEEKNDWSDFTALCIFYVSVNLKAGLLCVACDIPAARKVCGFLGHMAKLGCSKCTKEFHINLETGHACFGCFNDGEDESPLRNESDHREQADLASMQTTQAAKDRIESQYGSRFTALNILIVFVFI